MVREAATTKEEGYVLDLKFDVLSANLSLDDKLQLDLLINDWQGVSGIIISVTGHSDSTRIAQRPLGCAGRRWLLRACAHPVRQALGGAAGAAAVTW